MPIEILAVTSDHIESFHRTFDIVARERRYLGRTEAPPLAQFRAFAVGVIEKRLPWRVAIEGGEVVGWCDITPSELATQAHSGRLGMGLVPTMRGSGLGTRLLHATVDAARDFGLTRVELDVYDDNPRAIRLYERAGFLHEGVKRNAARIDGVGKNLILMAIVDLDHWRVPPT